MMREERYAVYLSILMLYTFLILQSRNTASHCPFEKSNLNVESDLELALQEFNAIARNQNNMTQTPSHADSNAITRPANYYRTKETIETQDPNSFQGVVARAFEPWKQDDLPCLELESDWKARGGDPSMTGILYAKPMKTGSSTAAGITLRLARNLARRRNQSQPLCQTRFDHAKAVDSFAQRDRKKSFLWTVVRDPTDRIVSLFFHFWVSRMKKEPSDQLFQNFVKINQREWVIEHYQHWLSLQKGALLNRNPSKFVNQILADYDFIAVTERMDESAVALSMLMDIPLADVLHLSSKVSGGFDDGGYQDRCTYIVPSHVSPGMKEFFRSDRFQNAVHWDHILHQAANRSLDLTIEKLGREAFQANLLKYRQAQELAADRCASTTTFPCSSAGGKRTPDEMTDCIWSDAGCGYKCLDSVATELNLWGHHASPIFPETERF